MMHLNDIDIQEYLDGHAGSRTAGIENHLKECTRCREELEQYKTLVSDLQIDMIASLPADFAASTAAAIGEMKKAKARSRPWSWILGSTGILGALATVIFLVDFGAIFEALIKSLTPEKANIAFLGELRALLESSGLNPIWVIWLGIILIIVSALDYIIRNSGRKTTTMII
nr:hypothetical protein [candidate division Zixibacteria bacterium]